MSLVNPGPALPGAPLHSAPPAPDARGCEPQACPWRGHQGRVRLGSAGEKASGAGGRGDRPAAPQCMSAREGTRASSEKAAVTPGDLILLHLGPSPGESGPGGGYSDHHCLLPGAPDTHLHVCLPSGQRSGQRPPRPIRCSQLQSRAYSSWSGEAQRAGAGPRRSEPGGRVPPAAPYYAGLPRAL